MLRVLVPGIEARVVSVSGLCEVHMIPAWAPGQWVLGLAQGGNWRRVSAVQPAPRYCSQAGRGWRRERGESTAAATTVTAWTVPNDRKVL